ncbi:hypothetical protein WJX84_007012 [Apatococcus fuscideae]|uniref:Uncharacterized protein n=1 Tax=Apatococcus fuscideae TaxID=2026836 RepID=A0AAW1SS27_9CHLO
MRGPAYQGGGLLQPGATEAAAQIPQHISQLHGIWSSPEHAHLALSSDEGPAGAAVITDGASDTSDVRSTSLQTLLDACLSDTGPYARRSASLKPHATSPDVSAAAGEPMQAVQPGTQPISQPSMTGGAQIVLPAASPAALESDAVLCSTVPHNVPVSQDAAAAQQAVTHIAAMTASDPAASPAARPSASDIKFKRLLLRHTLTLWLDHVRRERCDALSSQHGGSIGSQVNVSQ